MKSFFATILFFSMTSSLLAASGIEINNAYLRLPPPGTTTAALFFDLSNNEKSDRSILKVSGAISDDFEMHEMAMDGGKMSMRKVEKITLKKNSTTSLKPGGFHIMVFNLKRPLKDNEALEIKLELDHQEKISIKAIVKKDL
jgi:copper(I)-binding protein